MDQSKLEALLGRSLSTTEVTNRQLYLNIATQKVEKMLCIDLTSVDDTRTYDAREGYSTLFTDVFTEVTEVKVDGVVKTEYTPYQWSSRNASWFNSLVFPRKLCGEVIEITGSWGFDKCPSDLQQVIAKIFAQVAKGAAADVQISSKKVEDFAITFANAGETSDEALSHANRLVLDKYKQCNIGAIRHGGSRGHYGL